MSSDKNRYLIAMAKLTKKHGIKNFVALCPLEYDLAWSEDKQSYFEKVKEAEAEAKIANPDMTLLKSNLAFGPQTHLIHFLTQCAIIGKCPYKNLLSPKNTFEFAPIHTDDIARAVGSALDGKHRGEYHTLSGSQKMNLRQIMNALEVAADKSEGSTRGPLLPPFDYVWDFFFGTGSDVNMARMVDFLENNQSLSGELSKNTWSQAPQVDFAEYYNSLNVTEEEYAYPTMAAYKCVHLD